VSCSEFAAAISSENAAADAMLTTLSSVVSKTQMGVAHPATTTPTAPARIAIVSVRPAHHASLEYVEPYAALPPAHQLRLVTDAKRAFGEVLRGRIHGLHPRPTLIGSGERFLGKVLRLSWTRGK